ncbi:MAG: DUF748 domain-containing protein, partial [Candidatus Omnitrophica bacterium]|nr:DUF748 domain-containing protein [Candidatus Omnitrophota bacterium]
AAAAFPALLIRDIKVTNASLTYIDEALSPRFELSAEHLDLSVRNFSLTDVFDMALKAAVFSSAQDIDAVLHVKLDLLKPGVQLTDVKITIDRSKIQVARLVEALPMLKPVGLKDPLKGVVKITSTEISAGVKGLVALKAEAALENGNFLSTLLPVELENISAKILLDEKNIELKEFKAGFAGGAVTGTAMVKDYLSAMAISGVFKAEGVNTEKVLAPYKLPLAVTGKAFVDATFKAAGTAPVQIVASFEATATADVRDGALKGGSPLKIALSSIPMLPDLWGSIEADLPPETQADAQSGVTQIESCHVEAHVKGMTATLDKATLVTRDFSANVTGMIDLPDELDLKAAVYIQPKLAAVLTAKVPDLAALKDDDARVYLPMTITGAMTRPGVQPDMKYLSKKLIMSRGKNEIQKVLGNGPEAQAVGQAVDALFGILQKK